MWWLLDAEEIADNVGYWLFAGGYFVADLLPWGTELASVCDALEHYQYDLADSFSQGSMWADLISDEHWDLYWGERVRTRVEEEYNLDSRLELQGRFNTSVSLSLTSLADRIDALGGTGLPLPSLEEIIRAVLDVPADIVFATFDVFIEHLEEFVTEQTDRIFEISRRILLKLI